MKRLGKLFLLLAFQAVIIAQSVPASVEGTVTNLLTGDVISKATLDLQSTTEPTVRYPAVTSIDGRFTFRNVKAGRYSLTASRSGYVRSQYGQRGPNSNATTLTVVAGQRIDSIRIGMVPSGVISGRLLDREGEPVPDAQVHAWKITYRDGWRVLVPVDSQASNDLGEYRLFGLPPGQYYVSAQPEPRDYIRSPAYAALGPPIPGAVVTSFSAGQSGAITDPSTANRTAGKDYAPVYFGGTTDQFSAAPIHLPAGAELRGMDIAIDRIPMASITGTLVDAASGQLLNAVVIVTPIGANSAFTALGTVNVTGGKIVVNNTTPVFTSNGTFQTPPLPRGRYLLSPFLEAQGRRLSGQAIVDMADTNVANTASIRIALSPVPDLSGQVLIEGRTESANDPDIARIRVGLRSTISTAMDVSPQPLSATGAFKLGNIAASDYVVNVSPGLEKGYVRSIQAGNTDILNDGLRSGSTTGEIRIVIGTNPGAVTGIARDENGAPLSNVTVALLPDEYHRNRIDLYRSAASDDAGRYSFDRVPPGDYRIFAWEDVEKDQWRDPTFMRQHENRGKGITVGEGTSVKADPDVIRLR
jgi:hypothetical protein